MINKFAILMLNKEIKKSYLYFLAEVFRNIFSISKLHLITKFHLTTIFLCIKIILTVHKGLYFKI